MRFRCVVALLLEFVDIGEQALFELEELNDFLENDGLLAVKLLKLLFGVVSALRQRDELGSSLLEHVDGNGSFDALLSLHDILEFGDDF